MPYITLLLWRLLLWRHPRGARVFNPSDTRRHNTETALHQLNKYISTQRSTLLIYSGYWSGIRTHAPEEIKNNKHSEQYTNVVTRRSQQNGFRRMAEYCAQKWTVPIDGRYPSVPKLNIFMLRISIERKPPFRKYGDDKNCSQSSHILHNVNRGPDKITKENANWIFDAKQNHFTLQFDP